MDNIDEKWAIFWCDLLKPVIFGDIEAEGIHSFLKQIAQEDVVFPNGKLGKPSLSTLRRKLKKYQQGGFNALFRKSRADRGKPRCISADIIADVIELKKEQPYRSHKTINRFLQQRYGLTLPCSTIYHHLKQAGATRLKLGIVNKKVRKRWTKDNTHDLWVGDFEEGPYVMEQNEVFPTYLSAFIDCHSRYIVGARYYLRQNLDILVDSLIRALSIHGAPLGIYLDNAKVYHSLGLKSACYRINTRLIYRPEGDPAPAGLIERFFLTVQNQFESEVRAGDILDLEQLNHSFSAWLNVSYHKDIHSETEQSPNERYKSGLRVIRHVDIHEFIVSFMQKVQRRVNPTFSDVQLNRKFYQVDPRLRGDKVEVRYDPFSSVDTVEIYSLTGQYLCAGKLHQRQIGQPCSTPQRVEKPKHNYLDLLVREHQQQLDIQTRGIDYRNVVNKRTWQFHDFAKTLAGLLGRKGALTSFSAQELETLKKTYNQCLSINKGMLKQAFENAYHKDIPYVVHELKQLIKEEVR